MFTILLAVGLAVSGVSAMAGVPPCLPQDSDLWKFCLTIPLGYSVEELLEKRPQAVCATEGPWGNDGTIGSKTQRELEFLDGFEPERKEVTGSSFSRNGTLTVQYMFTEGKLSVINVYGFGAMGPVDGFFACFVEGCVRSLGQPTRYLVPADAEHDSSERVLSPALVWEGNGFLARAAFYKDLINGEVAWLAIRANDSRTLLDSVPVADVSDEVVEATFREYGIDERILGTSSESRQTDHEASAMGSGWGRYVWLAGSGVVTLMLATLALIWRTHARKKSPNFHD